MRQVKGIIPVVLTPLTKEKDIDVGSLVRIIEFLHTKNVGGLWVLGTGSEDMNLTFNKRLHVAQVACDANKGKLPLILGAGFFAVEDTINFMEATKGLNFDAYHMLPYNPKLDLSRVAWVYRYVAEKATKPLWMYTSGNWSQHIPPGFVQMLSEHPNIAGIKFSSTDTKALSEVISLANENFQVITAVASQLYTCVMLGSAGHTSSLACCLPEPMVEIYKDITYWVDLVAALSKQRRLNRFLNQMAKNTKTSNFLQAADEKYILHLRGLCDIYMTDGYREISTRESLDLVKLLKKFYPDYFLQLERSEV